MDSNAKIFIEGRMRPHTDVGCAPLVYSIWIYFFNTIGSVLNCIQFRSYIEMRGVVGTCAIDRKLCFWMDPVQSFIQQQILCLKSEFAVSTMSLPNFCLVSAAVPVRNRNELFVICCWMLDVILSTRDCWITSFSAKPLILKQTFCLFIALVLFHWHLPLSWLQVKFISGISHSCNNNW